MSPRKRARAESAYERRIRRYLEAHPGASRQEARGHKQPAGESEYRRRIRRYEERNPGASRAEAGGRARTAFLAYIREGDVVMLADHISRVPVDSLGRIGPFHKQVVPEAENRRVRMFRIPRLTRAALRRLIVQELERGAVLTPVPSLDQRKLVTA